MQRKKQDRACTPERDWAIAVLTRCVLAMPPIGCQFGGNPMPIAVVTGASTGIGLATAVALGRAGHNVYATMRNPARAPELAEIAAKEKLPIKILAMDVDDDTSVSQAIAEVLTDAGRIDVLVNNAG